MSSADAPIGKPKVIPPYINKYENEEITLLCKIDPTASGHPRCANYIWIKYGNQRELFPKSIENKNEFKFIMNEKSEGRYVCKCENEYGQSQASEASTVWLIKSTSASMLYNTTVKTKPEYECKVTRKYIKQVVP